MPDWLIDLFKSLIPAIIIAYFTSVLAVRQSIKGFYKEKWWEEKFKSYSKLLESLHRYKIYTNKFYYNETWVSDLSIKEKSGLYKEWKVLSQDFSKLSDLASFHLNRESVEILEDYKMKISEAHKLEPQIENIKSNLAAVSDCLEKLKESAQKDLGVNKKKYIFF